MFKVILLPIDVADLAPAATMLSMARELSNEEDATFVLLNVVEEVPHHVVPFIPGGVHKEAASRAESALTQLAEDHGILPRTQVLVREGHPPTIILEVAQETGTDVIVIASHDPGPADYFLGSVAARVVRHAHCSVLVARNVTP